MNRKTVVRKFLIASLEAKFNLRVSNLRKKPSCTIEFDDLETFEHTKSKPLSVILAVEQATRRILGFEVAQMPAKGLRAGSAKARYGPRIDHRNQARNALFARIAPLVSETAMIKSDSNPHYRASVHAHFPQATYVQYLGKRGASTGQGELKKVKFDPLFSLNHTCAKLRADISRLVRKTWCTTKRADRLYWHLALYASYHNRNLPTESG